MRKLHTITTFAAAALLLLGAAACSTTEPVATQISDADVTARVDARLAADPEVSATRVDVDTQDGLVRLSGTVETDAARHEAVRLALNTRGVRGVTNELKVGDKTVGEAIDDKAITTKVNAKLLADLETSATNIDVDTNQGVVTLSGVVRTENARAEAARLAASVKGVVDVDNRLEIQSG